MLRFSSRNKKLAIALKIEQNQPLNFVLKTYISRFSKLASKYFVNNYLGKQSSFLNLVNFLNFINFSQLYQLPHSSITVALTVGETAYVCVYEKILAFSSETGTLLEFSCVLPKIGSKEKFS